MPQHVFREYDVRGLTATELTPGFAEALGRGFGRYLLERDPAAQAIVLGRDHRTSSPELARGFARGVREQGIDVIAIGVVPTPLTYFAANTLPVDGLCMITGSHNPPEYNGFKVGIGKSTMAGPEVQALKKHVLAQPGPQKRRGREAEYDIITPYLHFVTQTLGKSARKLKVVVDPGNGTGAIIAPRQKVRAEGADLGVAFDGDSDRLGAVDENGQILWGDQILLLFARDVLEDHPGATIVSEVKCSQTLYDDIEKRGGRAIMWKAGHSLIKAKMKEEGALLAGEMSGHLFFRHRYYGFDDGIYSAARLLELVARKDVPFSQLLGDVPRTFSSPEIRKDFPDDKKFAAVEKAKEKLRKHGRTIEVDGVRVIVPGGWGLIRASNTQPLLVLRYESESEAGLRELQKLVEGVVEEVRRELSA
ncbi:MAG: phosphomannomutase/phosphoglucomutase [Deltaproteobacteria bacterium]|nr:MAG: phosphomannomutase/phosphoglucomutase [Deltaproteobacteria bacterium]